MFASKSLAVHLTRGALGISLFAYGASLAESKPLIALIFILGSLIPLRGCPVCWTVGLIETLQKQQKYKMKHSRYK
jgi:hypothetical protein